MNQIKDAARASTASPRALSERLLSLNSEALSFVPRDKPEAMARQWLAGVPWHVTDQHWTFAVTLALEVAVLTPSMMGLTAFDRLARAMKTRPHGDAPGDGILLSLLRRSRFCYARLSGARFEDLAARESQPLLSSPFSDAAGEGVVFGRFAFTPDGAAMAAGVLLPLDAAAEAVARAFTRPGGRALTNPVRCAEAVYRHTIRQGTPAGERRKPKLPFDPEHNPLDALAAHWAALDGEPGPEETARAREFVGQLPLVNALVSVGIAREGGAKRLAEAYRRIAVVLVETMATREAHGVGRKDLDAAAATLDAAIARGDYPREAKVLLDTLRERARLAAGRPASASGDLDRLVQRIRGLREKTVEQGCTEQEALAAAEKVAELLDRHGLSLSELDLRKQNCEGIGVDTNRKRRGPIDDCMGTIATFFDCRVWGETSENGLLRYIFFGLPADVQAAVYLHDLIALVFTTETATFQAGDFYASVHTSQRRSATGSFQFGLARGIIEKLQALRQARDVAGGATNGRALVPVKRSMIEEEMERLGLTFRAVNASRRKVIPDAFSAGKEAGERFDYRPGIGGE